MARDYQAYKNNPHWIPNTYYKTTIAFIRSYPTMCEQHDDILQEMKSVSDMDGMPHGSGISDEVANKAIKVEKLKDNMLIIENALSIIPIKYQMPVWRNIILGEPWPTNIMTARNWGKWKYRFVHKVAVDKEFFIE